ncbi:hypothetical protein DFH28DRAFT_66606 [Melampsora americana]|nr:hypothetical protein DFH28DRAFT_66606 [Melampsora americana]
MTRISNTLLAAVFVISPCVTGTFNFAKNNFKFEGGLALQDLSWTADQINGAIEKLFVSFDHQKIGDVIDHMHPDATFINLGDIFTGDKIGKGIRAYLPKSSYIPMQIFNTEISQVYCFDPEFNPGVDENKMKVFITGQMERGLELMGIGKLRSESMTLNVQMTLVKTKKGKIQVLEFNRLKPHPQSARYLNAECGEFYKTLGTRVLN